MISVTVNGAPQRHLEPLNIVQLLASMQLAGKRVAVERNGEIVPRSRYSQEFVADGDELEIVVAVGGG